MVSNAGDCDCDLCGSATAPRKGIMRQRACSMDGHRRDQRRGCFYAVMLVPLSGHNHEQSVIAITVLA